MNVVDSSGWIEYLSGGSNADFFADPIEASESLVVPTLSIFEVFKHVLRNAGRENALRVAAAMRGGSVVDLTSGLALEAAELSAETRLAMADSIILATARAFEATLWTQVEHFRDRPGVCFRAKPK
mgnify:CR=1 FL=1